MKERIQKLLREMNKGIDEKETELSLFENEKYNWRKIIFPSSKGAYKFSVKKLQFIYSNINQDSIMVLIKAIKNV